MDDFTFQREVLERLTRLEIKVTSVKADLKGWKAKVVVIASVLGAFIGGLIGAMHR